MVGMLAAIIVYRVREIPAVTIPPAVLDAGGPSVGAATGAAPPEFVPACHALTGPRPFKNRMIEFDGWSAGYTRNESVGSRKRPGSRPGPRSVPAAGTAGRPRGRDRNFVGQQADSRNAGTRRPLVVVVDAAFARFGPRAGMAKPARRCPLLLRGRRESETRH